MNRIECVHLISSHANEPLCIALHCMYARTRTGLMIGTQRRPWHWQWPFWQPLPSPDGRPGGTPGRGIMRPCSHLWVKRSSSGRVRSGRAIAVLDLLHLLIVPSEAADGRTYESLTTAEEETVLSGNAVVDTWTSTFIWFRKCLQTQRG